MNKPIHRRHEGEAHWFTLARKKRKKQNKIAAASRRKNRKRS